MKKNKMMRLASLVLVLTLLSTCAISGTFAKYVTTGTGTDLARVAKFGVAVTANGTMFAKEYATDNQNVVGTIAKSVVNNTNSDNLLAPGTKGDMISMALTGKPEVAVRVSYTANIEFNDQWKVDGNEYCPIIVTINNQSYSMAGLADAGVTTIEQYETYLENLIAAYTKDYAANTDLSTVGNDALDISWEWAFEGNDDAKDTVLGNSAAQGTIISFSVEIVTTVTQID